MGQKRVFPKVIVDHRGPFGVRKQVDLAHFEAVLSHFGPPKVPKAMEFVGPWELALDRALVPSHYNHGVGPRATIIMHRLTPHGVGPIAHQRTHATIHRRHKDKTGPLKKHLQGDAELPVHNHPQRDAKIVAPIDEV